MGGRKKLRRRGGWESEVRRGEEEVGREKKLRGEER